MGKSPSHSTSGTLASARVGDVVLLRCPSREALVAELSAEYVSVRWPWNAVDPDSLMRWNGIRAIPRTPRTWDWDIEPFRITSPDGSLTPGERCEVGIPDVRAYVVHVAEFPEPLDVGWLPRPHTYVSLVAHGVAVHPHAEEIGFTLDPDGSEPIESELVHRPYAFLADGDEVADSEGRVWRYSAPWNWTPFDNGPGESPVWPLVLVHRDAEAEGAANPAAAESVADATGSGTHRAEMDRWLEHAGLAEVPRLPPAVFG